MFQEGHDVSKRAQEFCTTECQGVHRGIHDGVLLNQLRLAPLAAGKSRFPAPGALAIRLTGRSVSVCSDEFFRAASFTDGECFESLHENQNHRSLKSMANR